jgi:hypothetical protein
MGFNSGFKGLIVVFVWSSCLWMEGYKLMKGMIAKTINLQVAYFCGYLNGVFGDIQLTS